LIDGKDCIAIDRVLCEVLGIPAYLVFTLKAAQRMNAGAWDLNQIEIVGCSLEEVRISDFLMTEPMPIKFQFWRVIRRILRNLYYRWVKEKKEAELL
jgi:uncharacterized protein (DUF362 family)